MVDPGSRRRLESRAASRCRLLRDFARSAEEFSRISEPRRSRRAKQAGFFGAPLVHKGTNLGGSAV